MELRGVSTDGVGNAVDQLDHSPHAAVHQSRHIGRDGVDEGEHKVSRLSGELRNIGLDHG